MAKYGKDNPYHPRMLPVDGVNVIAHPLYKAWCAMKDRCYNKDATGYANYGARGIKVCARWYKSFAAFAKDMGLPPTLAHSIDRINNDIGYEPSNCRWADRTEQCHNRRTFKNNSTGFTGVVKTADGRFASRYDDHGVRYQFGRFETAQIASDIRTMFIALLPVDRDAALTLTERRARHDSSTGVRGITKHSDGGFVVRKTIGGIRKYLGYSKNYEDALALWKSNN